MKNDYCAYPPQIADDVEIAEQRDGARLSFIVGSASLGRYLLLRATENQVVGLIDGARAAGDVCAEFNRATGATLSLATLVKFLGKLDSYGVLAGQRSQGPAVETPQSQTHYIRFNLFNPDPLFARLAPKLRWIWTTGFFAFSASLMLAALLLALVNWAEVSGYSKAMLGEHWIAVFAAAWLVGVTHEFAHGMTCKVFGGRATEVGALMVYYFLPALYCNVSGIHLIPQRNRRLWVIAAGVYWQLMVSAVALLAWFCLAPHTLLADAAFIFLLGSVLDVFFNANPLIKLDGYYFLSQWLRLPNLMDRSRSYWRGVLKRILFGERNAEAARYDRRERAIYLIFGLLSFAYNVAFASLIVAFVGGWLIERFYLLGLALAVVVALIFMRRPIKQMFNAAMTALRSKEDKMADNNQTSTQTADKEAQPRFWRRRLVPASLGLLVVIVLLAPWSASVGNYGTLIAIPGREAIIRAPESATLIALDAQPGTQVAIGASIGRMSNFDLEEQSVQAQSELARANADYDRLLGELRTQSETAARAELQLRQRQTDFDEINNERQQIERRRIAEAGARQPQVVRASATPSRDMNAQPEQFAPAYPPSYPAALAVLQSEIDSRRAELTEASASRDRARKLHAQGIMPRSELDAAETRASTLASSLAAARERLEAALVEHRRKHTNTATEMNVARTDASAERLQIEKLTGELKATREIIASLEERRDLLRRKQAQFELVTPRAGAVFGEELPRMVGNYFQKGVEICRVADTGELLLRVNVPEREIGDVRAGHPVRLKTRAHPDRVFRGVVSKIGGESEIDQNGQTTYRVELTIENGEGLLRPGMTAFARIDFDRRMIGLILLHKIKQALRPELWML
ncbi:MAG: efflux RND transporter periplasmic adaptor subunit [Blastocatellales bacterium]